MISASQSSRLLASVLAGILVVSLFTGVAAAQTGIGGTVTVESGETVSSVSGVYGTIVIEGTVTGDVSGIAGNVVVEEDATVEGSVNVAAGNVRISGTVLGDVSVGAGTVHLTETGTVGGSLAAGAADVRIDGQIGGDARVGADTITLGENASIAGSLTYDGSLEGNLDAVAGEITRDRSLGIGLFSDVQPFLSWVFALSAFLLNLALGALLLALFPRFSDGLADRVSGEPLQSGAVGFVIAVGVPVLLVLTALTVVGIPLALGGLLLFLLLAWVGTVYGRYAVGVWLLSYTEFDNRWLALLVGLVLAVVLWQIPIAGGLLNVLIFVLGLGALVRGLVARGRARQTLDEGPPDASA